MKVFVLASALCALLVVPSVQAGVVRFAAKKTAALGKESAKVTRKVGHGALKVLW